MANAVVDKHSVMTWNSVAPKSFILIGETMSCIRAVFSRPMPLTDHTQCFDQLEKKEV